MRKLLITRSKAMSLMSELPKDDHITRSKYKKLIDYYGICNEVLEVFTNEWLGLKSYPCKCRIVENGQDNNNNELNILIARREAT